MARTYKYHFIYHIRILIGSKKDYFYVGLHSTNNIDDDYCGSGTKVSRIIKGLRKKGHKDSEIYKRTIITFATSRKEVVELESIYVTPNIRDNKYCLNNISGGKANFGLSDETRAKMSKVAKGRKISDETKKKISKTNTGKHHTDETRTKISKNSAMKRPEVREMASITTKNNWKNENVRRKRIEGLRKVFDTDDFRKKLSDNTRCTKWLNKDGKNKRVHIDEVELYITNGWSIGRTGDFNIKASKSLKGKTPWNKGKTDCYSDDVRKKCGAKNKGMKPVNNGIICKKIHESEIDEFLANNPDWKLGLIKKSA